MRSRVAIGIPVYNGERFLERALDSVLGQTFEDLAVVICDNGSTDGTEEICRNYAADDDRVRYLRIPVNQGAAWNFNNVVRISRSEFFKWASHDDVCEPGLVETCVRTFDESPPSVVLCYPQTMLIDAKGDPIGLYDNRLDLPFEHPHQRLGTLVRRLALANPIFGLIRRDALAKTRLLGAYHSSDLVLLSELALQGEFREVPEILLARRMHSAMSREANPSTKEVLAWFDPSRGRRRVPRLPRTRVFIEQARAVARAPIGNVARIRSLAALTSGSASKHAGLARKRLAGREPGPAWARGGRLTSV